MRKRDKIAKIPAPTLIFEGKELLKQQQSVIYKPKSTTRARVWISSVAAVLAIAFASIYFFRGQGVDDTQSIILAHSTPKVETVEVEDVKPQVEVVEEVVEAEEVVHEVAESVEQRAERSSEPTEVLRDSQISDSVEAIVELAPRDETELIDPVVLVAELVVEPTVTMEAILRDSKPAINEHGAEARASREGIARRPAMSTQIEAIIDLFKPNQRQRKSQRSKDAIKQFFKENFSNTIQIAEN